MSSLIGALVRRGREERLAQGAGGLTFTTVLSLVPLLVVSFALFTRIPVFRPVGEAIREHLLLGLLPPELARSVLKQLAGFARNAGGLTLAGSAFLLVSAVGLVLSIENTLNRIWLVKKPRPLLRRAGLYAAMLLAGPALLGAGLWASAWMLAASNGLVAAEPPWLRQAVGFAPVVLAAVGFACLFRFVPHAEVRRRDAAAGGLLAGAAFEFGKRGFALYLASVPTYRTIYGAFAPLLAFFVWVYYSWLVTLGAALVSANLGPGGSTARGRVRPTRRPPRR